MAVKTTKANETSTGMKPTLGLTGVTINAMALIAPGAFLLRPHCQRSSYGETLNVSFIMRWFLRTSLILRTNEEIGVNIYHAQFLCIPSL
jgi:hypothetical protein